MYNVKRGKIQEVCISEQNRGTIQTPVDNELFFSFSEEQVHAGGRTKKTLNFS